jgi:hypothetical protein
MIYWVDEHFPAFDPWIFDLTERDYDIVTLRNADEAFAALCRVSPDDVQLVLIDVMLAVVGPELTRFGAARTAKYLETGLCLLEDLCPQNGDVFPERAVFLTNTSDTPTLVMADAVCARLDVPLWKKSEFYSPEAFGDRVEAWIRRLSE